MSNEYTGYPDLLAFYHRKRKEYPKGVSPKLQNNKHLLLQFNDPTTGKRTTKSCNVSFSEEGIILALSKAHKVRQALDNCKTSSEFWEWYDLEILNKNEIKNDLKTYREIFKIIEDEYFNGHHKNTGRKRSKNIANDLTTFNSYYGKVFNKFTDLDNYPKWEDLKSVLFSWEQGTKQFKDNYRVLCKIAKLSHNKDNLLDQLENINPKQTIFQTKQSISFKEFSEWYDKAYSEIKNITREVDKKARQSWLWVASMCVIYGLRPSEIAASKNLTEDIMIDGVKILALNNPNNKDLLLYIDDFTYFGTSIKTGKRLCLPVTTDKKIIEKLKIQNPLLPISSSRKDSKAESKVSRFDNNFSARLKNYNCPITQKYAFRHLYNQLGEMYGIPQEIRARSLGHSVSINDSVYKKRSNIQTTIDLLTNHSKQPLSLALAKEALNNNGFNLEDNSVQAILKIIYQIDSID